MGTTSVDGLAYALYDINANGEVLAWADTSGDGLVDAVAMDIDGVPGADIVLRDTNADGLADDVISVTPEEGGFFEGLFEVVGDVLSLFW